MWYKNRSKRTVVEESNMFAVSPVLKTVGLMFRTVKPDGILIYAATNKHYTSVEVKQHFELT